MEIDGRRLPDLLHRDHQPGSILLLHKNAFPSGKGAMLDAYTGSKF